MSAPTLTSTEPSPRSSVRRWAPVAAGAVIWWSLYHWSRPFWNWVIFDGTVALADRVPAARMRR